MRQIIFFFHQNAICEGHFYKDSSKELYHFFTWLTILTYVATRGPKSVYSCANNNTTIQQYNNNISLKDQNTWILV